MRAEASLFCGAGGEELKCRDCYGDQHAQAGMALNLVHVVVFAIILGPISWSTIRAMQQRERELTALFLDGSVRGEGFLRNGIR